MSNYISDEVIWKMRDELSPPYEGYVMFASSGADYNIECLVDDYGLDESDCVEYEYGGQNTVWIPLKEMMTVDPTEYKRIMESTPIDVPYEVVE